MKIFDELVELLVLHLGLNGHEVTYGLGVSQTNGGGLMFRYVLVRHDFLGSF